MSYCTLRKSVSFQWDSVPGRLKTWHSYKLQRSKIQTLNRKPWFGCYIGSKRANVVGGILQVFEVYNIWLTASFETVLWLHLLYNKTIIRSPIASLWLHKISLTNRYLSPCVGSVVSCFRESHKNLIGDLGPGTCSIIPRIVVSHGYASMRYWTSWCFVCCLRKHILLQRLIKHQEETYLCCAYFSVTALQHRF